MEERRVERQKILLIVFVLLITIVVGALIWFKMFGRPCAEKHSTHTVSTAQLEEVLEIAEFSSLENVYNAVAAQYDDKGNPVYHVAYEGVITTGIIFSEIQIEFFEENKQVTITLPEPQVLDTAVNMGTMKYVFHDSRYETEHVSIDAYQLCVNDLAARASAEDKLLSLAKESAIDTVKALYEPWLYQLDEEFVVVVR